MLKQKSDQPFNDKHWLLSSYI